MIKWLLRSSLIISLNFIIRSMVLLWLQASLKWRRALILRLSCLLISETWRQPILLLISLRWSLSALELLTLWPCSTFMTWRLLILLFIYSFFSYLLINNLINIIQYITVLLRWYSRLFQLINYSRTFRVCNSPMIIKQERFGLLIVWISSLINCLLRRHRFLLLIMHLLLLLLLLLLLRSRCLLDLWFQCTNL